MSLLPLHTSWSPACYSFVVLLLLSATGGESICQAQNDVAEAAKRQVFQQRVQAIRAQIEVQAQAEKPALDQDAEDTVEDKKKADEAEKEDDSPAFIARPKKVIDPKTIWLHTTKGEKISGKLSVDSITVTTEFGALEIPIDRILSFRPGLDNRPQQREEIVKLILQLGDAEAKVRDGSQQELSSMGPRTRRILESYSDDEDAERRTRVRKILSGFDELSEDLEFESGSEKSEPLIDEDMIETVQFTVVGDISPKSFALQTNFGSINIDLKDIRLAKRETGEVPEINRMINITGSNLAQFDYKNTGIRLQAGDQVQISASGKLVMSPWGNNSVSTPDGSANYQWYVPNKIPGGALIGKIGSSGKDTLIGSKKTFTADRPGVLYLAVAMNHQYANRNYQFPGEYRVKIHVNPKD